MKLNLPRSASQCRSNPTEAQKCGRLLQLHNVHFQGKILQSLGSTEVLHVGERHVLLA